MYTNKIYLWKKNSFILNSGPFETFEYKKIKYRHCDGIDLKWLKKEYFNITIFNFNFGNVKKKKKEIVALQYAINLGYNFDRQKLILTETVVKTEYNFLKLVKIEFNRFYIIIYI